MLKGVHQKLETQQTPAFFVRGPSIFSRMVFFCALSISIMAIDARLNYLSQVRHAFIAALHPLEVVANAPSEWTRDMKKYFSEHNQLVQENYALKQQAFEQKVLLQRLTTIEAENTHLRSQLPDTDEKSMLFTFPVRVTGAVAEKAFAIFSSSINALRMKSAKGSPSGVFIGPTPRHVISLRPGCEEVKGPTFRVFPLRERRATTLSAEIE